MDDLSWNVDLPPQWLIEEACQEPTIKNEEITTTDWSGSESGSRGGTKKVKSFMSFMVPGSFPIATNAKLPKKPPSGLQDIQIEVNKVYRKVDELKEGLKQTINDSNGIGLELDDSYTLIENLKTELRSARGYIENQESTIEGLVGEIEELKDKLLCHPSQGSCCCYDSMSSCVSNGRDTEFRGHLRGGASNNNSLYRILRAISEDFNEEVVSINSGSEADVEESIPTLEELQSNGVDINRIVRILKSIVSGTKDTGVNGESEGKKLPSLPKKKKIAPVKPEIKAPVNKQAALTKEVETLKQQKSQMRAEIASLQDRLRITEAKQKDNVRKAALSNDTIRGLKAKVDLLETNLKQNKSDSSTEKSTCNHASEIRHLQYRIKSTSSRILEVSSENKELKTKVEDLQKKLDATRERTVRNEQQNNERQILMESYRNKIHALQSELDEIKSEKQTLDTQLKSLHKTHSKVKSQVDVSKQEMETKIKEYSEMEQQVNSLNQELASFRTQKMRLKDLEKEVADKNEVIRAMEINNKIALEEHAEQSAVYMEDLKDKLGRAESWINEYLKFGNLIILDFQKLSVWRRKCDDKEQVDSKSSEQSLKAAQSLACNILNISNRQMESIMMSTIPPASMEGQMLGWADISTLLKNVHDITSKVPFAQKLSNFLVDIIKRRLLM